MASPTSFADVLQDWEKLRAGHADNAEVLAPAEPQRAALEQVLTQARELKARQDSHNAQRQRLTQEINALLVVGREAARRYRAAVKANMGTKNKQLVQFDIAPIPERVTRKAQTAGTKPPGDSTGTPAPQPPAVQPAAAQASEADAKEVS